jgi:hypothetical protein
LIRPAAAVFDSTPESVWHDAAGLHKLASLPVAETHVRHKGRVHTTGAKTAIVPSALSLVMITSFIQHLSNDLRHRQQRCYDGYDQASKDYGDGR